MKNGYIDRLVNCGMSYDMAYNTYRDIIRNFGVVELEIYTKYTESKSHVDKV